LLPIICLAINRRLTVIIHYESEHYSFVVHTEHAYAETLFPDGTRVPAVPHTTKQYRQTAERLGYGDDVAALSREHEFIHSFLCQRQGLPYSPTLWAVAHNHGKGCISLAKQRMEESVVLAFQRYLNGDESAAAELPEEIRALRPEALRLLREWPGRVDSRSLPWGLSFHVAHKGARCAKCAEVNRRATRRAQRLAKQRERRQAVTGPKAS
jgi:hypothetical protein